MFKPKSFILKTVICVFLITCVAICLNAMSEDGQKQDKELYKQISLFSDALTIVQSDYVEEMEPKKLVYGALEGLLASLDDYSQFLTPEDFKEMQVDTSGEYGGLGIEISMRDGVLTIISPIDDAPAQKAGLKAGDKIIRIDGESTRDITITGAITKLRGKPKTKAVLTILREAEEELLEITVVREIIKLKSIKTAEMIDKDIAYVRLAEFQKNSAQDLEKNLTQLTKNGMKALIFDLRNNPGGLLDVAFEVSAKFLPKDTTVVSLKGRVAKQNKVFTAENQKCFTDFPMVVLVNEGSASASEIVAGAIQDNRRGIVLGAKTFGKGSVQTVIPLNDGSAVRITTAAYYTPKGQNINEKGIVPDIEVMLVDEKGAIDGKTNIFDKLEKKENKAKEKEKIVYDNQVRAAKDLLKGILLYKEKPLKG